MGRLTCHTSCRSAFSLIEALTSLTIMSFAGAVLLLSVQSSLDTTIKAVDRTIADGIAQQMLHEILTRRYTPASGSPLDLLAGLLSPSAGSGTSSFTAISDYAGYTAQPLQGMYGETLGTGDDSGNLRLQNFRVRSDFFQNWKLRVDEYYVTPSDHTVKSSTATYFRAIEVHVDYIQPSGAALPLAARKRVVTYVPPPTS
jgi:type II secretory pathway pseudopilin PulG